MKKMLTAPCALPDHNWAKLCRWRKSDQVFFERCTKCGTRKYGNELFWRKKKIGYDDAERDAAEKRTTLSGSVLTPEMLSTKWRLAQPGAATIWLDDGSDVVVALWKQEHRCGPTDADRALAAHIVEAHNAFVGRSK